MASLVAHKRLTKEYLSLKKEPVPLIEAHPEESDVLNWHYVITGPPGTPYQGGQYHGLVTFPKEYPYKPPSIKMLTPNGRFVSGKKICLSMSDYHPETWNPAWSVSSILVALMSFMTCEEAATGCERTTISHKRQLAQGSKVNNSKSPLFKKEFPHLLEIATKTTPGSNQKSGTSKTDVKSKIPPSSQAKVVNSKPLTHQPVDTKKTTIGSNQKTLPSKNEDTQKNVPTSEEKAATSKLKSFSIRSGIFSKDKNSQRKKTCIEDKHKLPKSDKKDLNKEVPVIVIDDQEKTGKQKTAKPKRVEVIEIVDIDDSQEVYEILSD